MRDAIRQQLITQIADIEGRCFEPHAADKNTAKPYLVIEQGADSPDTDWTGYRRIVTVWPNISWSRFKKVDQLADKIINALHNQLLTTESGEVFTCIFLGATGSDMIDKDWDILTRGLQFAILALQPVGITETVANDPWIDALCAWSEALLGSSWAVYRNIWPCGYRRPSVLWRLSGINITSRGRAVFEIRKTVIGHVLGATPNQQIAGIVQIMQGLGNEIKIPLDVADRRYLTVSSPAGDFKVDALKAGQISLILSRLTSKPITEVPPIGAVNINGEVNE